MRLVHKIALLLLFTSVLPIATVAFGLVWKNEQALESEVRARFDQVARHAAESVAAEIEGKARALKHTADLIEWNRLGPAEARGALALLRRQTKAAAAALYSAAGEVVALDALGGAGEEQLRGHAPLERARKEGAGAVVFSAPYRAQPLGVTLAAAFDVHSGVVALALPLAGLSERLDEVRGSDPEELTLVDDSSQLIARSRPAQAARLARREPAAVLEEAREGRDGHARRFVEDGRVVIAAFAPVGGLGWSVVVVEEADRAFAAPHAMRRWTLGWTAAAAVLALVLASAFARRLTASLDRLALAARALGRGELGTRVEVASADEVGALARTFNSMGEELESSRAEIERWNRELEARVEERTRELREAQAQLVQAQKLAALGQLGAGVAHEINNPLTGVLGHVQLLLAGRAPGDADYQALRSIDDAARRASQVVQNLLRFSVQHQEAARTSVDLNRLVRGTMSLTETLIREQKIELNLELADGLPRVQGDPGQLSQVVLNLIANARAAMPSGGRLSLTTTHSGRAAGEPEQPSQASARANGVSEAGDPPVKTTIGAGDEVALAVADTGRGIAPEIRDRIFEPFFTTKQEWSNVGLGLSVSYRIISEHGGRIAVESELGRGSRFTVYLPVVA